MKSHYGQKLRGGLRMGYDEGYESVTKMLGTVTIGEFIPENGEAPEKMTAHAENFNRRPLSEKHFAPEKIKRENTSRA